jgi:hypothetical protein
MAFWIRVYNEFLRDAHGFKRSNSHGG